MKYPASIPENPSGKQTWLMVKLGQLQVEKVNLQALTSRLITMKQHTAGTADEIYLDDVINSLTDAHNHLDKYISAIEHRLPLE